METCEAINRQLGIAEIHHIAGIFGDYRTGPVDAPLAVIVGEEESEHEELAGKQIFCINSVAIADPNAPYSYTYVQVLADR